MTAQGTSYSDTAATQKKEPYLAKRWRWCFLCKYAGSNYFTIL